MAKAFKTPGGGPTVIHMGTDEEAEATQSLIERRHRFSLEYCKSQGWPEDFNELSIDQVLEIGDQPGWKDPYRN